MPSGTTWPSPSQSGTQLPHPLSVNPKGADSRLRPCPEHCDSACSVAVPHPHLEPPKGGTPEPSNARAEGPLVPSLARGGSRGSESHSTRQAEGQAAAQRSSQGPVREAQPPQLSGSKPPPHSSQGSPCLPPATLSSSEELRVLLAGVVPPPGISRGKDPMGSNSCQEATMRGASCPSSRSVPRPGTPACRPTAWAGPTGHPG